MIIVMAANATDEDIQKVISHVEKMGCQANLLKGSSRTIINIIGEERNLIREQFSLLPRVENVIPILKPYKLASREYKKDNTKVEVHGVTFGGRDVIVIAGPCSVENEDQLLKTAIAVKSAGASLIRGGAFKPRTSPYTFQGLGKDGLKLLAKAREATGLGIVTEVIDISELDTVMEYADLLQVGSRNMYNTKLLRELSKVKKPILLKRNFSATLNEFLMSAEYLLSGGNDQIILCERGIRSFVEYSRNTLDLNIIPAIKQVSHLPIIVDPSHGTGRSDLIIPMSRAAIAAGADGLMIEVHPYPPEAYSDGEQSLTPDAFQQLMKEVKAVAQAIGRNV
jgi:3-deoxy-7-phosphoheptulonate synthase